MEIKVRTGAYGDPNIQVIVEEGGTQLDLGMLDETEAIDLVRTLLEAASEITYKYDHIFEVTDKALDVALACLTNDTEY